MPSSFIEEPDQLDAHLARWRHAPFLALDTEFVREDTYHARLCLIQVGDREHHACIDTLAGLDLRPLLDLLCAPDSPPRVFHAAGQDLEIFVQLGDACPQPLFDTQIAAGLLGYGEQLGYAALVEKMLGVRLDKSLSRTDWSRRPLSERELAYAIDDVRYLAQIQPRLEQELIARGRLAWLHEDCAALADPARYHSKPDQEWKRLRGLGRLNARAQQVAAALAAWREIVALERNRPRRWILADDALYALAERQPQSAAQLAALGVLAPRTLERHGGALLERIAAGQAREALPLVTDQRPSEAEKQRYRHLSECARRIANELDLPLSLLAPRADLEALLSHGAAAAVPLLRGWRREVAGAALLEQLG